MPALRAPDLKTFASTAELKASYAAGRARLMGASPQPKPPKPAPVLPPALAPVVAEVEPGTGPAPLVHDDIRDIVTAVATAIGIEPAAVLAGLSDSATKARRIAIAIARRRGVSFVTRRFGVGAAIVHDATRTLDAILLHKSIAARFAPLDDFAVTVSALWDDFDRAASRSVPIGEIKRSVAEMFGVPVSEIDSARRNLAVTQARHIAMGLVKRLTSASLPEIGRQFGGRDHTTVLHAVRKYQALIDEVAASLPADARPRDWALALRRAVAPWQGEP